MPNCFCYMKYGSGRNDQWKTKTVRNSVHPVWEEFSPIIDVCSQDQIIYIEVRDESKIKNTYEHQINNSNNGNKFISNANISSITSGVGGNGSNNISTNKFITLNKF